MSYDGNFMRFDRRFVKPSESAQTDYHAPISMGDEIGSRLRKVGDFAIKSTNRLRDVSDFVIKDKDFAMWMTILGIGAGVGGLALGVYLGDKLNLMGKSAKVAGGLLGNSNGGIINKILSKL